MLDIKYQVQNNIMHGSNYNTYLTLTEGIKNHYEALGFGIIACSLDAVRYHMKFFFFEQGIG
jgi:hypothetical protein